MHSVNSCVYPGYWVGYSWS